MSRVSALIWFGLALAYLIVPRGRTGQTIGRRLVGGHPGKRRKLASGPATNPP